MPDIVVKTAPNAPKMGLKKTERWYILPVVLFFLSISCIRLQWPELSHGDNWSDASVVVSGENFANLGFLKTHFLPIFRPGSHDIPTSVRPDSAEWTTLNIFGTYTRLPSLYDWVAGICYPYFGDASLLPYRIIAVIISGAGVAAFFLIIQLLFNSARLACLVSIIYISNPYFIANFDSIHEHAYMDALRNISFLALILFVLNKHNRRFIIWGIAWVALLLESLTTYEYLPWITLTIIGVAAYLFFTKERKASLAALLLGTAFAVGLLLHFGMVVAHYGNFQEAFHDRLSNAVQRISGDANLLGSAGAFSWSAWWQLVALRFPEQVSVIGLVGGLSAIISGLIISLCLPQPAKKTLLWAFATGFIFCVGAFLWYILMPAHCVDHAGLSFLQKFLLPGICLLLAIPAEAGLRLLENAGVKSYISWPLALALPLFICIIGLANSELPLSTEKINSEREFIKIKSCLTELRPKIDYEDFVASNLMRPTWMMMYYTHSRTIPISTAKEFEALPVKPKFFLFVPLNNPDTAELGKIMGNYYKLNSTCDNKRLPFYILERL